MSAYLCEVCDEFRDNDWCPMELVGELAMCTECALDLERGKEEALASAPSRHVVETKCLVCARVMGREERASIFPTYEQVWHESPCRACLSVGHR